MNFCPEHLKLYPFQEQMVRLHIESPSPYIYNAAEMGLGKTVMAPAYSNVLGHKKLLYVVPASLQLKWISELNKWLHPGKKYVVVSYSLLVARPELLKEIQNEQWDCIIFDEFHQCIHAGAQRTVAAYSLWDSAYSIYMNSGTPVLSTAADLWPFLYALTQRLPYISPETRRICEDPGRFGSRFAYRYTNYLNGELDEQFRGTRNEDELCRILYDETKSFFPITKEEALPDLPELHYQVVPFDLRIETSQCGISFKQFQYLYARWLAGVPGTHFSTLSRLLGTAKAKNQDIIDYYMSYLEAGEPIIIFAKHKDVVATHMQTFKDFKPVRFTGDETKKEKDEAERGFQEGKYNVFIGNMEACIGLTLTRASNCFFNELDWLPHIIHQAAKRILRIGQTKKCVAHFCMADNEFDQHMAEVLVRKDNAVNKLKRPALI